MHTQKIIDKNADKLKKYFVSHMNIYEENKPLANFPPGQVLVKIEISVQDVKDVFHSLNIHKACGPDLTSPPIFFF